MIDERFSVTSFSERGLDSPAAQELANLLAREIQEEMHRIISANMRTIVQRLNAMGHALEPDQPPVPGDVSYRDEWEDEDGYHCKLRVGFDTIVSVGYAHLTSGDDIDVDEEVRLVREQLEKALSKKSK